MAKVFLFFSSYLPLWVILILFHLSPSDVTLWVSIAALVIGLIGLARLLRWVKTNGEESLDVDFTERQDGDSVAYIVTYILPFLTLATTTFWQQIGVLALFATIMSVYVSSDMIYVNPVLAAMGWHTHSLRTTGGAEHVLITKRRLIKHPTVLRAVPLTDTIWWDRGEHPQRVSRQSPDEPPRGTS